MGVLFKGPRRWVAAGVLGILTGLVAFAFQNCGGLGNSGAPVNGSTLGSTAENLYYQNTILSDNPAHFWRMGGSGTIFSDLVAGDNLILSGDFTAGVSGAINGDTDTAVKFNSTSFASSAPMAVVDPLTFSEEFWFKTTVAGGEMIGFGNKPDNTSVDYDRQIYMSDGGELYFGIFTTTAYAINTSIAYNDGQWHHVVGAFTQGGIPKLYVDGQLAVQGTAITTNNANGFIHLADDACSGWPGSPTNCAFVGTLDEVAVYPVELSAAQVLAHYKAGLGQH